MSGTSVFALSANVMLSLAKAIEGRVYKADIGF